MQVIRDIKTLKDIDLIATVGFFDGVHLGHRYLIGSMNERAKKEGLASAVITFREHPRKILHADFQPKLLNSFEEKITHLKETGIDYCIVLDFTEKLAGLTAKEFLCMLAKQIKVRILYVGYDHRFGHNRAEGPEEYCKYGAELGIEVINASFYQKGEVNVSSSEIRRLLTQGEIEEANALLTYPYQLMGHIVNGFKVGRTIGFPTANIQVDEPFKVIPGLGVYAVQVIVDGNRYNGMLYIGNRPTLNNGENISLEVNIFDFSADIYKKPIIVSFIHHIRGNIKFDSLDELMNQLERDKKAVEEILTAN